MFNKYYTLMIKFTVLNKMLKRDTDYIDNVMLGNYKGSECTCLLTFKSLSIEPSDWSYQLTDRINKYLVYCDALISSSCSTKDNIVLKFKVKLS